MECESRPCRCRALGKYSSSRAGLATWMLLRATQRKNSSEHVLTCMHSPTSFISTALHYSMTCTKKEKVMQSSHNGVTFHASTPRGGRHVALNAITNQP